MATAEQEGAVPDFLLMEGPKGEGWVAGHSGQGQWNGWPSKELRAVTLLDEEGRLKRVRAPVTELEGLITPTELHYVVQHFDVPQVVPADKWALNVSGEVKRPLNLNYEALRRFPGRTVRAVMECSGSDATYFEYFKGQGPEPSRVQEGMILSASEWTGVPLAAVLNEAGLTGRATHIRAEGWDKGVPGSASPGTEPFFYDKGLPLEKALHPDTILALAHEPDCWYHYNFYYYGDSTDDPNKELITTVGVKSMVTHPNGDTDSLPQGSHVIRGYAWSGAGAISQVEVSVDGGDHWHAARLEEPIDRWMWVRWSFLWDAQNTGDYCVMSRATDAAGRVQSREPRYNNMRKNFSAIVGYNITIK